MATVWRHHSTASPVTSMTKELATFWTFSFRQLIAPIRSVIWTWVTIRFRPFLAKLPLWGSCTLSVWEAPIWQPSRPEHSISSEKLIWSISAYVWSIPLRTALSKVQFNSMNCNLYFSNNILFNILNLQVYLAMLHSCTSETTIWPDSKPVH